MNALRVRNGILKMVIVSTDQVLYIFFMIEWRYIETLWKALRRTHALRVVESKEEKREL
ncbi:MAG: hypothetical protein JRJ85_03160 [Deltaproteobacteria bacterium]|nr:hypothetical protein [Deltaproteobacteria bacterium]